MNYYPRGNLVLVRPDKIDETTKGGIHIPEPVREQHQTAITHGTIIAMGPSADIQFSEDTQGITKRSAKVGERVIYAKYAGSTFYSTDKKGKRLEYRVLYDQDIVVSIDDLKEEIGSPRIPVHAVA